MRGVEGCREGVRSTTGSEGLKAGQDGAGMLGWGVGLEGAPFPGLLLFGLGIMDVDMCEVLGISVSRAETLDFSRPFLSVDKKYCADASLEAVEHEEREETTTQVQVGDRRLNM